ncbi:unnamed protein product [Durusdinium trenchii]|uniref:Uncharacterized protein n=1 Tax=Durusdinium trenchii TaxID=1381693 RepID=A0ABP0SH49_9DINO
MAILDQEHQQRIPVKVTAFRQFAANLMAQLTEQCAGSTKTSTLANQGSCKRFFTAVAKVAELLGFKSTQALFGPVQPI